MISPRAIHAVFWMSFATVLVLACAAPIRGDVTLGSRDDAGAATPFTPDDASTVEASVELTRYCPSSECPAGYLTCPTSRFRCDVNLKTDANNCGACGAACPQRTMRETFACIDGACVPVCNTAAYDCDGFIDNGCETVPSNDNCGGCGIQCTDPAKPCLDRAVNDIGCGCHPGKILCGSCIVPETDDSNCSRCGNDCDRTGGGAPAYPFAYYGCIGGECGALKCEKFRGNCDGDLKNGCEAWMVSNDNCGACGVHCPAGQECRVNAQTQQSECMCPSGQTFCGPCIGNICLGLCFDLDTDVLNCGACGKNCTVSPNIGVGACVSGVCEVRCISGRADCNGNRADFCEVDTQTDPNNCGGCGNVCDAVAGQACVGGRCAVEPCNQDDAGGGAR